MQKSVLIILDGPSLEALIFDAVDRAIKINQSTPAPEADPYGDFKWLTATCSGVPASTLRIKSAAGEIPGVVKFGKRVLYEKVAVLNWLRSQTRQPMPSAAKLEQAAEEQISRQLAKKGKRI
ncbi:hypothetical protein GCM10028819_51440 [Spirosoma humi]